MKLAQIFYHAAVGLKVEKIKLKSLNIIWVNFTQLQNNIYS